MNMRAVWVAFILAGMSVFLSGAVFLFSIFGIVCYLIYKSSSSEDRKFILTVLLTGFLFRVCLAVALHAIVYLKGYHCISGDDLLYTKRGWGIVCSWNNMTSIWLKNVFADTEYGLNPFVYAIAGFYKIFGFHPVTVKIINCGIGALIGWVSYLIGKEIFGNKAAKIAMLITMFYPSLVRWSVANLKDPITILAFMSCMYILIITIRGKVELWKYGILGLVLAILFYFPHKFYFITLLLGVGIVAVFRLLDALLGGRIKKFAVMMIGIVLSAAIYLIPHFQPKPLIRLLFEFEKRQSYLSSADYAGYYLYAKELIRSWNLGYIDMVALAKTVFASIFYFMLTPFPWQVIESRERLVALPQMLLWYMLLVLSIFGFMKLMLQRPRTAFLIGVIMVAGITISSLVEGNIGSAFRHRDVFTPFFILFASSFLSEQFYGAGNPDDKNMTETGL